MLEEQDNLVQDLIMLVVREIILHFQLSRLLVVAVVVDKDKFQVMLEDQVAELELMKTYQVEEQEIHLLLVRLKEILEVVHQVHLQALAVVAVEQQQLELQELLQQRVVLVEQELLLVLQVVHYLLVVVEVVVEIHLVEQEEPEELAV